MMGIKVAFSGRIETKFSCKAELVILKITTNFYDQMTGCVSFYKIYKYKWNCLNSAFILDHRYKI